MITVRNFFASQSQLIRNIRCGLRKIRISLRKVRKLFALFVTLSPLMRTTRLLREGCDSLANIAIVLAKTLRTRKY